MKIYTWLQKVIFVVMSFVFLLISAGTLYNFSKVSMTGSSNIPFLFIFGLVICLQLFIVVKALFRMVDCIERRVPRGQYVLMLACFGIMIVIFLILIASIHPRPVTDYYDDLDTAAWIASHGAVHADNFHIKYIGAYGNNYTLTLVFAVLLKVFSFLEVTGILTVFNIVNMAAVLLGVFLTWLIVKECVNIRAANKVLILCVLNPIYYCLVFWVYSLTLCLPFMMGIIYIAIRIYKCDAVWKEILCGVLMGACIVAGYELRPTAVFTLIAMLVTTPVLIYKRKLFKKILVTGVVTLVSAGILYSAVSMVKNRYFGEIQEQNFPVSFWLAMGSHGTGALESNKEAWNVIKEYQNSDERSEIFWDKTIQNYKELGLAGTANLWTRKTLITWADGYSTLQNRMSHGESDSYLFELLGGTHRQIFYLYCQAYRFLIVLGIVLFCLKHAVSGKVSTLHFTMLITLAGGVAFYVLWEAKDIYSAAFLMPMFILAQEGLDNLFKRKVPAFAVREKRLVMNSMYVFTAVLACLMMWHLFGTEKTLNYYRINTMYNERESDVIEVKEDICQDFYVEKAFNRITLMADADDEENVSDYTISLLDSQKNVLFEQTVTAEDINTKLQRIQLDFNKTQCDNHYYLTIKKNQAAGGDIHFYIRNTYLLDSYRGQLEVDGDGNYVNDLNMNVIYHVKQPYFSGRRKILFTGVYVLISMMCMGYIVYEQQSVKRSRQETGR